MNLGFGEIVLILVAVLVLFGPRRLPEIGRALGQGIREFQNAVRGAAADGGREAGEEVRPEPLRPMRAAGGEPEGGTAPTPSGPRPLEKEGA